MCCAVGEVGMGVGIAPALVLVLVDERVGCTAGEVEVEVGMGAEVGVAFLDGLVLTGVLFLF